MNVSLAIAALSLLGSWGGSAFISGTRWGRIEGDIRAMSARLARIEGMFVLRLREDQDSERPQRKPRRAADHQP